MTCLFVIDDCLGIAFILGTTFVFSSPRFEINEPARKVPLFADRCVFLNQI